MSAQRAGVVRHPPSTAPRAAKREAMFLQSIRDDGDWAAVPTETIHRTVNTVLASLDPGEEAPEHIVQLDLIYWADKGDLKPVRYYAARWRWKKTRVHELLKRYGLKGTPDPKTGGHGPDKGRTTRGHEADRFPGKIIEISDSPDTARTRGGQRADKRRTVYPDSDAYSDSDEGGGDPPAATMTIDEHPDAEQRAFNTRFGWPDRETVVSYCLQQKIPEETAREIWGYYQKAGWRLKGGLQIGDWRIAVADNYRENYAKLPKSDARPKTREELLVRMRDDPRIMEKHRPGRHVASGEVYFFPKSAPLPVGFEALS